MIQKHTTPGAKHFVESPTIVQDALEAQTVLNPNLLFDRENKILINSQHDGTRKVALLSGGGAGHEPSFAGLVGNGLLTAAVSGNIFASPSTKQIFNAVAHTKGQHGSLLVIMNYTGDVLHFNLAAEKAKVAGINTRVLVVGDDVSVGRKKGGKVGRRGLAGTVLVLKILGAMVEEGKSLDELATAGEQIANNLVTVGVSLDHVHVPGRAAGDETSTFHNDQMELGMGIHNEPGCKILQPKPDIGELVNMMLDQLLDQTDSDRAYVNFSKDDEVVLLVNNLGGVSPLEFSAIIKTVNDQIVSRSLKTARILAGTLMTSLDGPGFSITLLKSNTKINQYLDAPTSALGWSPVSYSADSWNSDRSRYVEAAEDDVKQSREASPLTLDLTAFQSSLKRACDAVIAAEPEITRYDTVVGDGDCGTTLARAATSILDVKHFSNDAVKTVEIIAEVIEDTMDGTSGALYAIFFNALAAELRAVGHGSESKSTTASEWIKATVKALDTLERVTPARVGDRTLMDALIPFVEALSKGSPLSDAVKVADKGKEKTKGMPPAFGRAVYVNEKGWDEVPDPGAEGIVCLLKGFFGM